MVTTRSSIMEAEPCQIAREETVPFVVEDYSKDREKSVLSSEAFVKLAMIQLMLHRLHPDETDAEFHYRNAD